MDTGTDSTTETVRPEMPGGAEPASSHAPGTLRKWSPLLILALALAIILIDMTLLNVSLATIIRDLDTTIQKIQWVITAYSLTIAAFMITGGRMGDIFGRKRMFMLGAVIFAIGSLIASISRNVPTLVVGEAIIEGIGAALMMPATMSLLAANFRGRDRSIAFGVWGGVAAASTAIGPLLGGYITSNYSWRWAFRINVFVAAILLLGSFLVKESFDREEKHKLDWPGVLLSSAGLFFLVFGIIESSTYGWIKAKEPFSLFGWVTFGTVSITVFSVILGLIILAGFFLWERREEKARFTPLVSLRLFTNRQFVSGASITSITALGQAGLIFSIPVFVQAVRGLDAFHTGLALLPLSVAALVSAPLAGIVGARIGPKIPVQVGLLLNMASCAILALTLRTTSSVNSLILGLAIGGAGMGMMMGQIGNLTISAVSVEQAGEAAGVNNTFRQIGATLGTAIIGAVLIATIAAAMTSGINTSTAIPDPYKPIINQAVKEQVSNVEFGGGAELPAGIPADIGNEIVRISNSSVTKGNRIALVFAGCFAFLGFLVSLLLPKGEHIERDESVAVRPVH